MTHAGKMLSKSTGSFLSISPVIKAIALSVVSTGIITSLSHKTTIEYSNIFGGIFDLTAIFAGFMSTFYMFIVTKDNEFLKAIAKTRTYKDMRKLLKFTIIWSALVIVFSYVLMIAPPINIEYGSWSQCIVFGWCLNVFLIAVNFWRCVWQFSMVIRTGT